jgi:hypothetical protein
VPTSHFSKAGVRQTAIWSVNFPKHSKPGPNTVLARPARRLTQNGIPQKRGSKMTSKMVPKKPLKNESKNDQNKTKNRPKMAKNDQNKTKNGADFITFYIFYYFLLYLILHFIIFNIMRARGFRGFSLVFVGSQRKCPVRLENRRNHLHLPFLQRAKVLARGRVLGPNRSHSHSPIRGLHGEDLNGGVIG